MKKEFSLGEWVIVKMPNNYKGLINERMKECENKVGIIIGKESDTTLGDVYNVSFGRQREMDGFLQPWCLESFYKD